MTDFSTLDNTLDSSQQPSLLLFRNYKRSTSNHSPSKLSPNYRSLSPKNKKNLAYPQNSKIKDILQSFEEEKYFNTTKIRKIRKIPELPQKKLTNSEILDISRSSYKPKALKSNILCLFNSDLKSFLEKKSLNSDQLKESFASKNHLFFLQIHNQSYKQLSEIFENLLLQEKEINQKIFRDLMRTIKKEFDSIFADFYRFISSFKNLAKTNENLSEKKDDFENLSFEKFIENLLQIFDLELNEKELFGILRPEKAELQNINSRYKRFSKDPKQKLALAERLEVKLAEDYELITKLKAENSLFSKENQELSLIKGKIEKESTENFRMVQERLKLIETRSLQKVINSEKNNSITVENFLDEKTGSTKIFESKIKEINDSLSNENLGLKQYNDVLLKKIARLTAQIKKLDMKKDKICMNKETDVQFFYETPQIKPIKSLRYILNNPNIVSNTPNSSYKWTLIMINLIYSYNIIQDMASEYESMKTKNLKELILEFFVIKFKSKYLVESLLRDFISNLKKYASFSQRIKTFGQLTGLILEPTTSNSIDLSNDENFPYKSIKSALFTQKSTIELYLRIVYNVRLAILNNNTISNSNNNNAGFYENMLALNKSFLSFDEDETLGLETAKILIPQLISQEGLNENIKDFDEGFQNVLETDLYERITNYNEEMVGNTNKSLLQNNNVIRLDFLFKFLLDLMFEKKISEYQQIFTLIKLQKLSKPELFFNLQDFQVIFAEVFPGNKNVKYIENCFIELVDELNEENHFNSTLRNVISKCQDNQKTKFPYFYTKITNSMNKQWKGSNEILETSKLIFLDWRSELGFVIESYKIFKNSLIQESRNNQKLNALHENFLTQIFKINKNILQAKTYDMSWLGGDKAGFLKTIDRISNQLLELLENILKENLI